MGTYRILTWRTQLPSNIKNSVGIINDGYGDKAFKSLDDILKFRNVSVSATENDQCWKSNKKVLQSISWEAGTYTTVDRLINKNDNKVLAVFDWISW